MSPLAHGNWLNVASTCRQWKQPCAVAERTGPAPHQQFETRHRNLVVSQRQVFQTVQVGKMHQSSIRDACGVNHQSSQGFQASQVSHSFIGEGGRIKTRVPQAFGDLAGTSILKGKSRWGTP